MDASFMQHPLFSTLPKEKQELLKQFAAQPPSGNTSALASQLSSAASMAKSRGLSFSDAETTLLLEIIKQNMSPQEQKKADQMIALAKSFHPKN